MILAPFNLCIRIYRFNTRSVLALVFVGVLLGCSSYLLASEDDVSAKLNTDNSAAFAQYFSINSIPTVIAAYKNAHRPGPVVISHPIRTHASGAVPGRNSVYPAQFLIDLSERSSLVVVARAGASKSLVMDDDSFLYSNFIFAVDQVLLDRDSKIIAGDKIYVTRAGGTLKLQEMMVEAVDPEFPAFESGRQYVLFLQHLPDSFFYKATAPSSFALGKTQADGREGIPNRLDRHPLEELSATSKTNAAFVQEVIAAIGAAAREQEGSRITSMSLTCLRLAVAFADRPRLAIL